MVQTLISTPYLTGKYLQEGVYVNIQKCEVNGKVFCQQKYRRTVVNTSGSLVNTSSFVTSGSNSLLPGKSPSIIFFLCFRLFFGSFLLSFRDLLGLIQLRLAVAVFSRSLLLLLWAEVLLSTRRPWRI